MPIAQSIPNPYSSGDLDTWSYCPQFSVDLADGTLRMVYLRYADRASSYAGKPPIERVELVVSDPAEFAALLAANKAIFDALQAAIDAYALTRPEFAGATEVP